MNEPTRYTFFDTDYERPAPTYPVTVTDIRVRSRYVQRLRTDGQPYRTLVAVQRIAYEVNGEAFVHWTGVQATGGEQEDRVMFKLNHALRRVLDRHIHWRVTSGRLE